MYLENDEVLFDGPFLKWSLDNYWLITLHDANNGAIRDIYPIGLVIFISLILSTCKPNPILPQT